MLEAFGLANDQDMFQMHRLGVRDRREGRVCRLRRSAVGNENDGNQTGGNNNKAFSQAQRNFLTEEIVRTRRGQKHASPPRSSQPICQLRRSSVALQPVPSSTAR